MPAPRRPRLWLTLGLCAALAAALVVQQLLELAPDAEPSVWLNPLLALLALLLVWPALWALMSKLFQHRFDFLGHLSVVAAGSVALWLGENLLEQAAAAFGLPALAEAARWGGLAVIGLTLWAHLRRVLPLPSRRAWRGLQAGAVVLALGSAAAWLALQHRQTDRWTVQLYLQVLPSPAMRWHAARPLERLMTQVDALQAPLQARAAQSAAEADETDDPD